MSGTVAASAGYPTGITTNGRSFSGPVEHLAQEAHRARRVRQRREPGVVQRGEQEPDGDPDGLPHVVVLDLRSLRREAVGLLEDDEHDRRVRQVRLAPVGAERLEGGEPLGRHPSVVAPPLLLLGGVADPLLQLRVGDGDERPRLLVRAGRRRRRSRDRRLDDLPRHGLRGEVPDRAPLPGPLEEDARPTAHLLLGQPLERERHEAPIDHRATIPRDARAVAPARAGA